MSEAETSKKGDQLEEAEKIKVLADLLQDVLPVRRFDTSDEPASWNLAVGLADIQKSCAAISGVHIPELLATADSAADVHGILLEIGEELRHILYHVRDMPFYRYLAE